MRQERLHGAKWKIFPGQQLIPSCAVSGMFPVTDIHWHRLKQRPAVGELLSAAIRRLPQSSVTFSFIAISISSQHSLRHAATCLVWSSWELMYLWWSLCTLYLLACRVRVTEGDSWSSLLLCLCDVSLAGNAKSIIFVATNDLSRQNTCFVATKVCLLRQNFCRDKNTCLSRQNTSFGREKSMLLATKCLSRQTRVYLSWQKFWKDKQFCRDKRFVATNIHMFVATKDVICRDKHVFVTPDKNDTCGSSRQWYWLFRRSAN